MKINDKRYHLKNVEGTTAVSEGVNDYITITVINYDDEVANEMKLILNHLESKFLMGIFAKETKKDYVTDYRRYLISSKDKK